MSKPDREAKSRAQYLREWYAANRDRELAKKREYIEANKDRIKQLKREWYLKNRELTIERSKQRSVSKHEEVNATKAAYRDRNREAHNEANRKWFAENPGRKVRYKLERDKSLGQRTPKWLTEDDHWVMEEAYDLAKKRDSATGVKWHVDHIVPLRGRAVSGLHVPWNLRVIQATVNLRKSARHDPDMHRLTAMPI